jgi:hypothetical protein
MESSLLESVDLRVIQMGNSLEYGTSGLKTYSQKSPGLKGLYETRGLSQGYRNIGMLFGSQPRSLNSLSKLEQYLQSKSFAHPQGYLPNARLDNVNTVIAGYPKGTPGALANLYSIEHKLQSKNNDQALSNKNSPIGCPRCGEELSILGTCNKCGWGSPNGKW